MPVVVDAPDGGRYSFESQAKADAFLTAARKSSSVAPRVVNSSADVPTSDDFAGADTQTGADFTTRLGASFKMTEAGKVSYLKSKYGDGNVFVSKGGETYFRDRANGRLKLFDEKGLSMADLADLGGEVPGAVASTVGAIAGTAGGPGGTVGGAAAGAAAGNAIRQNVSNLLPGDDNMSALERVGSAGTDAALAAGTQYGVNKLIPLADLARPQNLVARTAGAAVARPDAAAIMKDAADTGIPLTTSEATGSGVLRRLEDFSRRVPFVADRYRQFDEGQTKAAVAKVHSVLDEISAAPAGRDIDFGFGQRATSAFDGAVNQIVEARTSQAAKDFGLVGKLSGGEPMFNPAKLRAELRSIIGEYEGAAAGDVGESIVKQAKTMLDQLQQPGVGQNAPLQTADWLNRRLQNYGKAAAGKGAVFKDLETAQERGLSARLFGALRGDLDTAADAAEKMKTAPIQEQAAFYGKDPTKPAEIVRAGEVADALTAARNNYRKLSQPITDLEESVIGRYFGAPQSRTPERVADKIASMKPSELAASMQLLSRADPELKQATGRYVIERALTKVTGGDEAKFSATKFLKELPDDNTMRALIGGTPMYNEMQKVARVLERVADKPAEGSPTAGRLITWAMTGGAGAGLMLAEPISTTLGLGTTYLTATKIANAMLTGQGRAALTTLATTSEPTKRAINAAGYLVGLESVGSGNRPKAEAQQ